MPAATWTKALVAKVVTTTSADADYMALVTKNERGLILPRRAQEINANERPYAGWKFTSYSAHIQQDCPVGHSQHDVTIRADIQHAGAQQKDTEDRVEDILAQLAVTIAAQRVSKPFDFESGRVIAIQCFAGAGAITAVERTNDASKLWVVEGEYVFTVRVRLKNQP